MSADESYVNAYAEAVTILYGYGYDDAAELLEERVLYDLKMTPWMQLTAEATRKEYLDKLKEAV